MNVQMGPLGQSATPLPRAYVFGPFWMDVTSYQLFRHGQVVTLAPKVLDTLLVLLRNRERLIGRDELIQSVWADAFVSEDNLTQTVSVLRRTLGDDSAHPRFISTVARRGYRFIAPVKEIAHSEPREDLPAAGPVPVAAADGLPRPAAIPIRTRRPISKRVWWWGGAVALALLLAGLLAARSLFAPETVPGGGPVRFSQDAPENAHLLSGGALSPDGRSLAFIAERSGTSQIWVRTFATAEAHPLPGTDQATKPFWSPDGKFIAFFAGAKLKRVGLGLDGSQTITDQQLAVGGGGGTWGPQRLILYAGERTGIYSVPAAGGAAVNVTALDRSARDVAHRWPQFLPSGDRFLYYVESLTAERTGTFAALLASHQQIRLLDVPAVYAAPGYLIFVRDHTLMAQAFDERRLRLMGSPVPLAGNASTPELSLEPVASASPTLLAFRAFPGSEHLQWLSRGGGRLSSITSPAVLRNPGLMAGERQVIASDTNHTGLWLGDLERGALTRISPDGMHPIASPNGRQIAFTSDRLAGVADIYLRSVVSQGAGDELLLHSSENKIVCDWSPDGRYLVYASINPQTRGDLWLLPLAGDRKPISFLRTSFFELQAQISPDGHWIAYTSDESGAWEVYVQSFPRPGAKQIISVGGGVEPHWRRDGRELYYLAADRTMMAVGVQPGSPLRMQRPQPLFYSAAASLTPFLNLYAVSSAGDRFLVDSIETNGKEEPIALLMNWLALVKH